MEYVVALIASILTPETDDPRHIPDPKHIRVAIYDAQDADPEFKRRLEKEISDAFPGYLEQGTILFIAPANAEIRDGIVEAIVRAQTQHPNPSHLRWSCKETMDYAYMAAWAYRLDHALKKQHPRESPHYIYFLEDDVYMAHDWWWDIREWMSKYFSPLIADDVALFPPSEDRVQDWLYLSTFMPNFCRTYDRDMYIPLDWAFSIGHIMHMESIPLVSEYLKANVGVEPVDLLLKFFAKSEHTGTYRGTYMHVPSLVQHMGMFSSFPGKKQPIKSEFKDDIVGWPLSKRYQALLQARGEN